MSAEVKPSVWGGWIGWCDECGMTIAGASIPIHNWAAFHDDGTHPKPLVNEESA